MKYLLFLLVCYMLPAYSQQRIYHSECGREQTDILWQATKDDRNIYLHTKQDAELHDYIMDCQYHTKEWRVANPEEKTNLTIEYANGQYYIRGIFHNQPISKKVKSKGCVWFQNIAFNAGLSLQNRSSIKYECFRPDNLKLYTMLAESQGKEILNDRSVNKVKVSLTGLLSIFWSCTYFFDSTTLDFILYKGVNGAPGTPETIITLKK